MSLSMGSPSDHRGIGKILENYGTAKDDASIRTQPDDGILLVWLVARGRSGSGLVVFIRRYYVPRWKVFPV